MTQDETTAADMLERVGRALFGDEWPGRLAAALDVRKDTLRKWRHGSLPIGADHPVMNDLLKLATRHRAEVDLAERELWAWLERNRSKEDRT
jgi:hypothetical protein